MSVTTTRIAIRLHRFEILLLGALTVLAVALTLLVCSWLDGTGFSGTCQAAMQNGGDMTPACQKAQEAFSRRQSSPMVALSQILLFFVPFLLAVLAGVAIVGRDVERGTARLAWSLAPSRMTWLAGRMLPMLGVVAAVALAAGLAADRLLASNNPGMNPYTSLLSFGERGIDLAARVVFAFACAVLIGALTGRTLPALLLAVIVVFVGLAGGASVHGRILAGEAVPTAVSGYNPADLMYDSGFLTPDGRLISWDEMMRIDGIDPTTPNGTDNWTPSYPQGSNVVPGTRYSFVAAHEVAALLGGAGLALGLSFAVVRRARPG